MFFDDVTNPGPVGTESTFNERDIATLELGRALIRSRSAVLFIPGPHNDRVTVSVDGVEDHRYDVRRTTTATTRSSRRT